MIEIRMGKTNTKGIYQGTTVKEYSPNRKTAVSQGIYKGNNVDVYSIWENDKSTNKLYYDTDVISNYRIKDIW